MLVLGAAIPFLTRPPAVVLGQYEGWLTHLTRMANIRWEGMRDAWTVWTLIANAVNQGPVFDVIKGPVQATGYRVLQFLAAGAAAAWCLWQQRRAVNVPELLTVTLGFGIAWLMIFGPAVESPTYVLLAPLAAWALLESIARRRAIVLAALAYTVTMLVPWQVLARTESAGFLLAALPFGSTLYTFWLFYYTVRPPNQQASTRPSPCPLPGGEGRVRARAWHAAA